MTEINSTFPQLLALPRNAFSLTVAFALRQNLGNLILGGIKNIWCASNGEKNEDLLYFIYYTPDTSLLEKQIAGNADALTLH